MKIVNILGGLGNQMFEYAMYLALKESHPNEDIFICKRCFNGYPLHNGYELNSIFDIDAPEANLYQLSIIAYPFFNYKSWQIMRHYLPSRKSMASGTTQTPFDLEEVTRTDNVFYDGYWQNENYFLRYRDTVIQSFHFPAFSADLQPFLLGPACDRRERAGHRRRPVRAAQR